MQTSNSDYQFAVGDDLLCYSQNGLYEAKCLKRRIKDGQIEYYIHYKKFNSRFDEWVDTDKVLQINDINLGHMERLYDRLRQSNLKTKSTNAKKTTQRIGQPLRKKDRPKKIAANENNPRYAEIQAAHRGYTRTNVVLEDILLTCATAVQPKIHDATMPLIKQETATHGLEVQTVDNKQFYVKQSFKTSAMKIFPSDPYAWCPVELFYHMMCGVDLVSLQLSNNFPELHLSTCKVENIPFIGLGVTIQEAEKECCIEVIKYFWEFDYRASEKKPDTLVEFHPTARDMKNFPGIPYKWCPIKLLHHMTRGIQLVDSTFNNDFPQLFRTTCEVDNILFVGQGATQKEAKEECCIKFIKHFWELDCAGANDERNKT